MSKILRTVGQIAGAVATVASFIPGAQGIAAVAAGVSAVTSAGAQLLAKPPAARGSATNVVIASDAPSPYVMGRTFSAGILRHDVGYGGRVSKVENPYRLMVLVHSVAGPIDGFESFSLDHSAVSFSGSAATGYYADYLYRDTQLGAQPESTALTPNWSGAPGWGASYKLSGKAATLLNLKFDKDGKRFATGVPAPGEVLTGVTAYDPREDSTRPGGSGSQRADDESTWTYSDNVALHALTYALGRHIDGLLTFGCGISPDGIDIDTFTDWANVCDLNGWVVSGIIYEPGSRRENLANIMAAGSGRIAFRGALLSVNYDAARVAAGTIGPDDLADGPVRIVPMKSVQARINGIVPKWASEAHQWKYVPGDLVTDAAYVNADGEERQEEVQFNLVAGDGAQASELAAYRLVNAREMTVELPLKPHMRGFGIGHLLTAELPDEGLDGVDLVMTARRIDPATMRIIATFESETAGKHDFALGRTTDAPPTATLATPEDRDTVATTNAPPNGFDQTLIATSYVAGVGGSPLTASDAGATASIAIAAHDRVYADKTVAISSGSITGLAHATTYAIYYDDDDRSGGSVTFAQTTSAADGFNSPDHPWRHHIGSITTPTSGGGGTGGSGGRPPGWGGGDLP